jgi:hypothetical protein
VTAEIVLRTPKSKQFAWAGIGSAVAAAGYGAVSLGSSAGWFLVFMGAFTAVGSAVILVAGRNALRLDAEGFSVDSLLRSVRYRWEDIVSFGVVSNPIFGVEAVVFELTPGARSRNPIEARLAQAVSAYEGGLPETYGLTARELCELLAARQATSLGGTTERQEWASHK